MVDVNKQIGRRIRVLRALRKLTMGKLAGMAKISEKHPGKVERGTATASIQCLTDIAAALELPVSAIVEADHERRREELIAEIIALAPKLSDKDAQIVYRFVTMLTNRQRRSSFAWLSRHIGQRPDQQKDLLYISASFALARAYIMKTSSPQPWR